MLDGRLTIWTIFARPADFPTRAFVIAVDVVGPAGEDPSRTPARWFAEDLEGARAIIHENDPTADRCVLPGPDDAACIVECWL